MPGPDDLASWANIATLLTAICAGAAFTVRAIVKTRSRKATHSVDGTVNGELDWESSPSSEELVRAAERGALTDLGLVSLLTVVSLEVGESDGQGRRPVQLTNHSRFLNGSPKNIAALKRRAWFETVDPAGINVQSHDARIATERGTMDHHNFSLILNPPLGVGEQRDVTFTCTGGYFIADHYWEQSVPVFTRLFQLRLHVEGGSIEVTKFAIRDRAGDLQNRSSWSQDGSTIVAEGSWLWPGQEVLLAWAIHPE